MGSVADEWPRDAKDPPDRFHSGRTGLRPVVYPSGRLCPSVFGAVRGAVLGLAAVRSARIPASASRPAQADLEDAALTEPDRLDPEPSRQAPLTPIHESPTPRGAPERQGGSPMRSAGSVPPSRTSTARAAARRRDDDGQSLPDRRLAGSDDWFEMPREFSFRRGQLTPQSLQRFPLAEAVEVAARPVHGAAPVEVEEVVHPVNGR